MHQGRPVHQGPPLDLGGPVQQGPPLDQGPPEDQGGSAAPEDEAGRRVRWTPEGPRPTAGPPTAYRPQQQDPQVVLVKPPPPNLPGRAVVVSGVPPRASPTAQGGP